MARAARGLYTLLYSSVNIIQTVHARSLARLLLLNLQLENLAARGRKRQKSAVARTGDRMRAFAVRAAWDAVDDLVLGDFVRVLGLEKFPRRQCPVSGDRDHFAVAAKLCRAQHVVAWTEDVPNSAFCAPRSLAVSTVSISRPDATSHN